MTVMVTERVVQREKALARANEVRMANADLRRRMKVMDREDALHELALVLEAPTPEQEAIPLHRLFGFVPRMRLNVTHRIIRNANCYALDVRVGRLTERQRLNMAEQVRDYAEDGYLR